MKEPKIEPKSFSKAHSGFHYISYRDGSVSRLMSKKCAKVYASEFEGTVRRHSQAPNWYSLFTEPLETLWKLTFIVTIFIMLSGFCSPKSETAQIILETYGVQALKIYRVVGEGLCYYYIKGMKSGEKLILLVEYDPGIKLWRVLAEQEIIKRNRSN